MENQKNPIVKSIFTVFFIFISLGLLILPVIQVWLPFDTTTADAALTRYTILRYLGLTLYSLIFMQIMSGAFRRPLNLFLNRRYHHTWHVVVGFLTLGTVFAHPLFLYLSNHLIYGSYIYLDNGIRFNIGQVLGYFQLSLVLLGFAAASMMNFFQKWMTFWRKIHWLMYVVFISATVHSYILGSDINTGWYGMVRWAMVALVGIAIVWRIYEYNVMRKGRT